MFYIYIFFNPGGRALRLETRRWLTTGGVINIPIIYLTEKAIFVLYLYKIINTNNSSYVTTFLNVIKFNTYEKIITSDRNCSRGIIC